MVGQDKFNLYVLPATNGNAGVIRFIPEDQKPANGWVQIPEFKETYRLGKMTEAQQKDLLARAAWRAPILPAEQTRSSTAEKTKPEKAPAPKPAGKIEDFGEKLGGAKKDKIQSVLKDLSDDDLRKMPLSQIWPKNEIDEIENTRAAAFATAARAEISAKPRKSYALAKWVEKVKTVRNLTKRFIENPQEVWQGAEAVNSLKGLTLKVLVLEELPRKFWDRIGKVELWPNAYSYGEDGQKVPRPSFSIAMDGQNYSREGKSVADIIEFAEQKLQAEPENKSGIKFEVRGSKATGIYKINKKGDPLYRTLKFFPTAKEALDFVANNGNELVQEWEKIKAAENVTEADIRRGENRIRSGEDYRKGKNITPDEFSETFGFRGVEFGNWVSQGRNQKERQGMLNIAYDAFMDLAKIIGVPPKALSLNGTLGIGFGSRGSGRASAHYEPNTIIINLTKTKGAGSLAHEWFHALDNYFSRERGGEKKVTRFEGANEYRNQNYITHKPEPLFVGKKGIRQKMTFGELQARHEREPENEYYNPENWMSDSFHPAGVRIEVEREFGQLVRALDESPMTKRAKLIDKGSSRGYWSSTLERAARAFETFIIESLAENNQHNDYLANVVSVDEFGLDAGRYPYLFPAESAPVKQAFKRLFQTVKTRTTDKGVKLYSAEYLVAKYAAQGLKQAAKIVRAGLDIVRSGAKAFATWAREMSKQFGKAIHKHLKTMYADLQALNKQLGRAGKALNVFSLLGKTAKAKRLMQQSDLVWKKDDYRNAHLEFIDPVTGIGETVATVRKNAKGQWELVDSNRAFLTLKSARTAVKSAIYEQMKQAEKTTEYFKQRQREKKGIADKYFAQPTGEELAAQKEAERPKTFAQKIAKFAKSFDRYFFNERQALEDWQQQVFEAAGRAPLDWENIAEQLDTIDGRIDAETADFKEKTFVQIKKDLVKNKISYDDFNDFLYAMHAKERNDYINEINPEFRARGVDGSGMSVKDAEEIKASLFAKYGEDTLMDIGEKYWKMHSDLLKVQQSYLMIDNETREIIDDKYEYYSPLKRIVDEEAPILLDQRATGRRSKAEDLLAFSDAAINTTFRRGEKTRTMNNVAALMLANPNPALYSVDAGKVKARFNEKTGEVEYRLNKATDKDKTIYVKFGGQLGTITIENKELFDAISGGNKDVTLLGKVSRALNAPLKLGATAWSISFLPVNLLRDIGLAYFATFIEKDAKTANKILVGVPAAIKAAYDYEAGIDSPGAKMFKEFLLAGGKTGYNPVEDMRRLANKIKSEIDDEIKNNTRHKITKTIKRILDLTESANNIIESGTRFSGYKTIIENGGTKQQAAAFAKNLTVNFNKYGKWGREINAWIAFGNPAVQGSKKVLRLLKKAISSPKGRASILAMVALGVVQELINAALSGKDDDDDKNYYEKLSAGEKDTAFIIMLPGSKEYASVPLPYGLNILPAIGRNTAAMIMGTQRMGQTADNIMSAAINAFSPIGQDNRGFVASAVPTAVKPVFDLYTNTKWTGKKIKPDQPAFDSPIPNSKRFYDSNTNKYLIDFFGWLHKFAGGTDYEPAMTPFEISPADAQYLLEYYTSSAGKDIGRVIDIAGKIMSGEEYELKDLPVIRRFYRSTKDYDVNDEYKDNVYLAKNAARARRDKNTDWLKSSRGKAAIKIEAVHKYFQKEFKKIDESGRPEKERREIEMKLKKRFNNKAREILQKNLSKN